MRDTKNSRSIQHCSRTLTSIVESTMTIKLRENSPRYNVRATQSMDSFKKKIM
eukprot:Gb_10913 [translate_table: standard]